MSQFVLGVVVAFLLGAAGYGLGLLSSRWTLATLQEQFRLMGTKDQSSMELLALKIQSLTDIQTKMDETMGGMAIVIQRHLLTSPPPSLETVLDPIPNPDPRRLSGVQRRERGGLSEPI